MLGILSHSHRLVSAIAVLLLLLAAKAAFGEISLDSPLRRSPKVVPPATVPLPMPQWLATPEVRTLVGYTRRALHLRDGRVGIFSYSESAAANWLFLVDGRDLSVERFPMPNNDIGSHGAAVGTDENIYIMPFRHGRAYRFDVRAKKFEPIATPVSPGELTWDAIGATNGCIYFGTYPNAILGEFNPATGQCQLFPQVAPNTKYTTDFSEDKNGNIRFKAWGPDEVWMKFDPRTRKLERDKEPLSTVPSGLPAPPKKDDSFRFQVTTEGRRFALSFPTSRFWEITAKGKPVLCGDPQAPAEMWFLESVPGAVVGISHFGATFRYDLKTGKFSRNELPNRAPGGNAIMFLEAITPRSVIGANYSQQNLFDLDPLTGKIKASDSMVVRVTGEPMCAIALNGKAYIGHYISSLLSLYDPEKPFIFGKNPRELIELGPRYQQTRPRDTATDGRLVFISSDSAYNFLGGALAVIDSKTDKVEVYHHLIRDQNLPTLAYDSKTKLLWGGTDRWGQQRSHAPTQESSLIYAFDPKSRKVVVTLMPWKGMDVTAVQGVSADGILVATSGPEMALIETGTRQVLFQGTAPVQFVSKIIRSKDGFCYFLGPDTLYRWNVAENIFMPVAVCPGCTFLTESSANEWFVANQTSVYRVKLPEPPSTTKN